MPHASNRHTIGQGGAEASGGTTGGRGDGFGHGVRAHASSARWLSLFPFWCICDSRLTWTDCITLAEAGPLTFDF